MSEFDVLEGSESSVLPSWEGFIVIDAKGRLVCWKGSKTPRLYSSLQVSDLNVPEGWALAAISIVPTGFTAVPRELHAFKYGTGFEEPITRVDRARVTEAALASMSEAASHSRNGNGAAPEPDPEPAPEAAVAEQPPREKRPYVRRSAPGMTGRIFEYVDQSTDDVTAGIVAAALNGDHSICAAMLANLFKQGKIFKVSRGVYRRLSTSRSDTPEPSGSAPIPL